MRNKNFRKTVFIIIALILVAAFVIALIPIGANAAGEGSITVMFTSDLHSQLTPAKTQGGTLGGFPRLKTLIDTQRALDPEALLFDGGDFSMGTYFMTKYETDALELRMLGALGYDATTIGNHEFDWGEDSLANMLNVAVSSGERLPQILASNTLIETDSSLAAAYKNAGVGQTAIFTKNGVKVGVFALMGNDARDFVADGSVSFSDITKTAKEMVTFLKQSEGAELIILISHCGYDDYGFNEEDLKLGKDVPEIDLIISGHTHTVRDSYVTVGDTIIVSAGTAAEFLGVIGLTKNGQRWKPSYYSNQWTNSDVPDEQQIAAKISDYRAAIDKQYFVQRNYSLNDVLTTNSFEFPTVLSMEETNADYALGNLIADSFKYAVEKEDGKTVTMAIAPMGAVRNNIKIGEVTVEDAFAVCSMGKGPDGAAVSPLVDFYAYGSELKAICEVDASVSGIMTAAQLFVSGVTYEWNDSRMIFDKTTWVKIDDNGRKVDPESKELYRIVCSLTTANLMGKVEEKSFGILKLTPKDENGQPVTDYESRIIKSGGRELKEWAALASYLKTMREVSKRYESGDGRKKIISDGNIFALINNPGTTTMIAVGLVLIIVAGIVVLILVIAKKAKKRKA